MKPNINSVEVHPELSNTEHPVDGWMDGALVGGVLVHCGPLHIEQVSTYSVDEEAPIEVLSCSRGVMSCSSPYPTNVKFGLLETLITVLCRPDIKLTMVRNPKPTPPKKK